MEPVIQYRATDGKVYPTKEGAASAERFTKFLTIIPEDKVNHGGGGYGPQNEQAVFSYYFLRYLAENPDLVVNLAKIIKDET